MYKQVIRVIQSSNFKRCFGLRTNIFFKQEKDVFKYSLSDVRKFFTAPQIKGKMYAETENTHLYKAITDTYALKNDIYELGSVNTNITSLAEFNVLMSKNYRVLPVEEALKTFKEIRGYCAKNDIPISDRRFDNLVDGIIENCEYLTEDQLYDLLVCLSGFPLCESYDSHNFHDLWSCLDDMCVLKINEMDNKKKFLFTDAWYKIYLARFSDFVFNFFDKLISKADQLNKDELVKAFFFFNVCRHKTIPFEMEYAVSEHVKDMTVDELAIVALGFFKTKSKIKIEKILREMMDKVIKDRESVNEVSLTAILKVIRLSKYGSLVEKMNDMLDSLVSEMDRLSNIACLHIAIIGTSMQTLHKASLLKACEKLSKYVTDVSRVRIKDIERLALALTMYNIEPNECYNLYEKIYDELHSKRRQPEISQYPQCMPCTLHYLETRNMYSYELMNKVFEPDYVVEAFGKNPKLIPRFLLFLDFSIDIDCPDYKGNRLEKKLRHRGIKYHSEFIPSYDQYTKIKASDKFHLDTVDTVKMIVKNSDFYLETHILPHFPKADIVLCKDKRTNQFIKLEGFDRCNTLEEVQFPVKDDNLKWFAIMLIGWNCTLRGTGIPVGMMLLKQRQLKTLGYEPISVIWNEFILLSKQEKLKYLTEKLCDVNM